MISASCWSKKVALFVLAVALAGSATAATITVNTLADELNTDGDCSLREAVQAANTNAAVDACAAGAPGTDTIILPAGTIPVASSIQVNETVTIRGAGRASTTVNSGSNTAFNTSAPTVDLSLEDMSVVGGANAADGSIVATRVDFSGGDTVNTFNGAITLTDVTLAGGSDVNTFNGAITLTDVTISGGGGINTSGGAISLTRAAIVNTSGTGINSSSGAITLVDSRVSGATSDGINTSSGSINLTRSLVNGSGDDGISGDGTITVVNSTISGNGDEGIDSGGTVTLDGVTITANASGGINIGGPVVTAVHTIFGPNGGANCGAPVTSAQFSIDSGATCGLAGAGNLSNTNPLLGPLANNGGPTQTHLPQAGSPAIDAGSNGLCQAVDQRSVARPVDGDGNGTATCDIGAVEAGQGVVPPQPPPVASAEIPTLSEWSLLLLSLLLAGLAMRSAGRTRRG